MVHWIEAMLRAGDVEVARAVGLRLRTVERLAGRGAADRRVSAARTPGTRLDLDPQMVRGVGFWNANEIRMVSGTFGARRSRWRVDPADRAARRR